MAPEVSRDAIEDIWGPRTPYKHVWPTRVDYSCDEEPEKWVQSACVLCSNGCGMDIGVKDGKVVGVRGRATDRVNKGRLGPKGMHGWKSINHADRLKYPLIRRNGRHERATWDEAMGLIVERSKELIERLTSHSIAFYTSGQLFLEEYYALAMVGKAGLHTLHMDGNTRLCTATAAASMRESFGSDGQPGSYEDIDYTDCIFMVGHNMASTQTVLWSRILDRLHGPNPPQLVVVDPRLSETARQATVHLTPRIGTNVALLNGLQHLMFKNGWVNREWTDEHVIGLEDLENVVAEYTPEYTEEITGVPVADLTKAAEILGKCPSLLSTALQGVYQSNQATAAACQVNNINLLRGHIGKAGSGIFQMNGQPTAQNNRETGCDGEYPAFRNHQNPDHMKDLADLWGIDPIKLPHWNLPTHIQNLLKFMEGGTVRMFWVSGTNPLVSLPNLPRIRKLFTDPNLFLVCQDIYMTETAALADVVLPAAQWGEKTGCFTNVDRTVHLSHKAVEPPGEARPDLDIFLDYARRMGFENKHGEPLMKFTNAEETFEEWKRVSKGRPCDYSGMTYDKLTGGSGIQWPCNEENPNGTERLFADGKFFTDIGVCETFGHDLETGAPYSRDEYKTFHPAGRAIIKACHYSPPMEGPCDQYPLRLSTGRNVYHFHTRTKTGRSKVLQDAAPEPEIRMHKEDAAARGVQTGDEVIVRSRRGAIRVKAKVGNIGSGQVFVPFHFGYWDHKGGHARAANELTFDRWDPVSKQPVFKAGAVDITKIDPEHDDPVPELQTQAETDAAGKSSQANIQQDLSNRVRRLEQWLGETYESLAQLSDIYTTLIPELVHDLEVEGALHTLHRITETARERLATQVEKYGEAQREGSAKAERLREGSAKAERLREALFPATDGERSPFEVLETLQALHIYLSHIQGALAALRPVSQAVWDEEFLEAVQFVDGSVGRMLAWVKQQISVRAPQTLLVPVRV